jgi:diguanylate cyclase (GGDEF)-like protein
MGFIIGLTLVSGWTSASGSSGFISVMTTAPITAAMLLGGPTAAAWVAIVGVTERRELRGEVSARGVLENHIVLAIAAALGGGVVLAVHPFAAATAGDPIFADLVSISCAGVAGFIANEALCAFSASIRWGRPVSAILRDLWPGETLTEAMLCTVGFLMAEAYVHAAWWLAAVFLIPLIAVRLSVDRDRSAWLAAHDSLTSLATRRDFEHELDTLLSHGSTGMRASGLLMVDLDRFKDVNDTLGHAAGDAVLREVGTRLVGAVRRTDLVARVGGDEFAIILRDVGDEAALLTRAQAIVAAVGLPMPAATLAREISASVGGALIAGGPSTAAEVLAAADRAMYHAKRSHVGAWIEPNEAGEAAGERPLSGTG